MRVLFDTNILISAFLFPGGQGEAALLNIVEGRDQLILSKPILHELLEVLARKFSHDHEELAHIAVYLEELAEFIQPRIRLNILEDEPDNRILECAVTGKANAVVTGDRAILQLGEFQSIRLISLKNYLELS
ncbi:MAG: putative toxin-antitoxin system toxin component, PIN family protein [Nitrospirales bacterium]|nr:MAG: putative toxin-antitoxin system toxin component, PIN family protein [Nitrospirales bacterium]